MKYFLLLVLSIVIFSSSCSNKKAERIPSSLQFSQLDLVEKSEFIIDSVATREINPQSCKRHFEVIKDDLDSWLEVPDYNFLSANSSKIIEKSRLARNYLDDAKESLVESCHKDLEYISKLLEKTEELAGLEIENKGQNL